MSNSSQTDCQPSTTSNKRPWLILLTRGGMTLGALLLVLIVVGVWRLRDFIHTELAPLAQQNLTTSLNRPVKLGKLKEFTLTGVKFAASSVPATSTDSDWVTIEAVNVSFDIWQLIIQRHLKLDVTLINPQVYIEQDQQQRWITTTISPPAQAGFIQTDLNKIRFYNAKLVLVGNQKIATTPKKISIPSSPVPVKFSGLNGTAQLVNNNQQMKFDVIGKADNGGDLFLEGTLRVQTELEGKLKLRVENFLAADVTRLIPLPLSLKAGRVNGDLQVELIPNQLTLLNGSADLQGVTVQIPQVPQLLSNTQGNLRFQGLAVELDNVVSNYGKIPVIAKGIFDQEKGLKLAAFVNAVSISQALETLNVQSPLPVSGIVKADLQILGNATAPVLSGNVTNIGMAKIDQVDFKKVSSKFELSSRDTLLTMTDIQAETKFGGEVKGRGKIKLDPIPKINVNLTAEKMPGDAIAQVYKIDSTLFKVGNVAATANVSGPANNAKTLVKWQAPQATYPATGEAIINSDRTVDFRNVAVNVAGSIVRGYGNYDPQSWQAVAVASGVKLTPFLSPQQLANISLENAEFNGKLVISGTSDQFQITNIRPEAAGINLGGGKIAISRLHLIENNFITELIAENINVSKILKLKPSLPILNNPITGKFTIAGNTENLSLNNLGGIGRGSLAVGNGKILAENIQISNGRYQAQVQAKNIPVQKLTTVPPQLQGILTGEFNIAGSVESFQPETIQATGQARLNLAGAKITATNIQVANGNYQALVTGSGVKLNRFHQQLQGELASQLQISGPLTSTKLADIRATGQVKFSQGIPGINSPLNAVIAWNGEQLTIPQARSKNLNVSGHILANAQQPGIPEISALNLNVQAQNYDLKQLPLPLANTIDIRGKADFKGQITGNITAPNVIAQLSLRNLQVQKFAFEPLLTGQINLIPEKGLNVDLAGKRDRLAANINLNQNSDFLVKWQQVSAIGQSQGDNWQVKLNNFPLAIFNFNLPNNPIIGKGKLAGILDADVQLNQKTLATKGNIVIVNPEVGRIKGDRFASEFNYNNDTFSLTNSEFSKNKSTYILEANLKQITTNPQIQAKVNIKQGQIQDILNVAQIFDIQDLQRGLKLPTYGKSADLQTTSQGLPNQPLLNQIQRLAEIDALLAAAAQKRQESQPIPNLTDFKGILDGEIAIDTATNNELAVNFQLKGENFTWGRETEPNRFYRAETVIAEGSFEKGVLRLQPLRIEDKKRLIAFTGNIGGNEQSGKLTVNNFPIQLLNNFVQLPVGISGNLNIDAALAGSIDNPQARGQLEIKSGTLNRRKIESATAGFSYTDGRLQFGSQVIAEGPEPVNITGDIPYKLPFASVAPNNNEITLDIKVKNEGLGLLNLFTDQIAFEKGEGEVDLTIRGTPEKPLVKGIATINNATFVAQALSGKLTNVTGKAEFDFNKVLVENIQGQFSDGKIEAVGEIPIFNSQSVQINNPLKVNLEKLTINLKGLYQGGTSGNLKITGSVLKPLVGGNIELSNGQVLLSESNTSILSKTNSNTSIFAANKQNKISQFENGVVGLNNLKINLGRKVQIASPPIFNFLASGELNVTGSLDNPIPSGTIKLNRGGVNLFTTQFKLASNYKHTATFRTSQPRDPELDIKLFAKILDDIQTGDLSRQVSTGGLSALETVRVEAIVQGLASQLNDSLELKSSPSRSQTEIVTLLGGGFLDTQGRGDTTLGLINIAGSAVFNNFQSAFNQIGDVFGLSELRLFPTILSDNPEAGNRNSSLELALEAGVDIANIFSISSIKILTANDPFQWGINYRINDEFRVRASTNLTDDSRAVIEFERRF